MLPRGTPGKEGSSEGMVSRPARKKAGSLKFLRDSKNLKYSSQGQPFILLYLYLSCEKFHVALLRFPEKMVCLCGSRCFCHVTPAYKNIEKFILETAVGRKKAVQAIGAHGEIQKGVVTLVVMSHFWILPGELRGCADFCDPTAASRFIGKRLCRRIGLPYRVR